MNNQGSWLFNYLLLAVLIIICLNNLRRFRSSRKRIIENQASNRNIVAAYRATPGITRALFSLSAGELYVADSYVRFDFGGRTSFNLALTDIAELKTTATGIRIATHSNEVYPLCRVTWSPIEKGFLSLSRILPKSPYSNEQVVNDLCNKLSERGVTIVNDK